MTRYLKKIPYIGSTPLLGMNQYTLVCDWKKIQPTLVNFMFTLCPTLLLV